MKDEIKRLEHEFDNVDASELLILVIKSFKEVVHKVGDVVASVHDASPEAEHPEVTHAVHPDLLTREQAEAHNVLEGQVAGASD